MAKDVDLSSREWTDIIFEGKNKEFGAYQLRVASARRHNMSMLSVLVFIAVVVLASLLAKTLQNAAGEEEGTDVLAIEQELVADVAPEEEDLEEDLPEEIEIPEPEIPEVTPEEVLNTQQNTEIIIATEVDKEEEVKTTEELQESATAFGATTFDQGTDNVEVVREHKDEIVVEEKVEAPAPEKVFDAVEEPPTFPGGVEAMYEFMRKELRYPEMAAQNNIQGRVILQFVVEKDGSVGEVRVVRKVDTDLDKEAVRMVKSMPKFIPGRMNGQSVRVWFTLPVNFKLKGS